MSLSYIGRCVIRKRGSYVAHSAEMRYLTPFTEKPMGCLLNIGSVFLVLFIPYSLYAVRQIVADQSLPVEDRMIMSGMAIFLDFLIIGAAILVAKAKPRI